jgi:hypothetical protein
MWLNELYKRWMGRTSRRTRRRFSLPRTFVCPRLEKLEDRTLLSAPAPYTFLGAGGGTTISATQGQFGSGGTVSGSGFSGIQNKSWNPSGGSISTGPLGNKWGAQGFLNLNVNALGVNYSASASGGNVTSTYNNVTLQQGYGNDPTAFGQQVSFTPQNTNVSYGGGSVNTSSPSLSAGVNLEVNMDGSVGGTAAGFGGSVSGSAPFSLNVDPSLLNVTFGNSNGTGGLTNLSIVGLNLSNTLNYVVSGASFADFQQQLLEEPPYFVAGQAQATTNPAGLQYVLSTGLGEVDPGEKLSTKKGGGGFASGGQVVSSLATISLTAPEIASSGNNLQGGGVVNGTSEGQILNMSLTPGAVLGLGNDNYSVGALSITFTLFNYTISESLDIQQSATVTPVNTLTYNFFQLATAPTISATPTSGGTLAAGTYFYQVTSTTAAGESTPSTEVSATTNANGAVALTWAPATGATGYNIYRSTTSGQEVLLASISAPSGGGNVSFTDTGAPPLNPNQFTPTSNNSITTIPMSVGVTKNGGGAVLESKAKFNPGTDTLGVDFNGQPIGVVPTWNLALQFQNQLELVADTTQSLTVGQVYGSLAGNQLFNTGAAYTLPSNLTNLVQVPIAQIANENFNIYSQSQTLPGFVIGGAFHTSLAVTSTADSNAEGSGSLRFAVNSANIDGVKTPQTITLGPGTYNLTLNSGTGSVGSYGALYINAQGSLIIQGAGAGETIINASGSGAGAFEVASGANLTLEGVTVEGANNGAAAISNSGSMTISDSSISNNSVGAIENDGSMSISDSGISDNTGEGGIFNDGTLTITGSTISNNTITFNSDTGGGGIVNNFGFANATLTIIDSTITANSSHTHGGGIAIDGGTATIINSTISGNRAVFDGGGIDSNYGTVTLYNTIVAGNASSDGTNDIRGAVSALSAGNLIGDGTGLSGISNGSNGNQIGTQSNPIAPLLSPLGNYGGPTQTMELLTGSPALNAGTTSVPGGLPPTDQRGDTRTLNAKVDIGAVEYQYDLDLIGYLAAGGAPGKVQYHYTVTNNGLDPVEGATLTIMLPAGISYSSATVPAGWTETNPGNGTVTFTDSGSLSSGQSASFAIAASVVNTTVGASFTTTASVGPTAADDNLLNNFVNLTVTNEQAGQSFNTDLYSFTGGAANATAGSYTGSVNWGQGDTTTSTGFGGSGTGWQVNGTTAGTTGFGGNGTGWTENGASNIISNNILTLTDAGGYETRSAFYSTPMPITGDFTASFTYTATSSNFNNAGDGFTFDIQTAGPTALNNAPGGLGYPSSGRSLAVGFSIGYLGVGWDQGGDGLLSGPNPVGPVVLNNSDPKNITLQYDSASENLTAVVTDTITNASDTIPLLQGYPLSRLLESNTAYVGFTASETFPADYYTTKQQISNFNFTYSTNPPGIANDVLTLTDGQTYEARSAFNTSPVSTLGNFTASFTYTATSTSTPGDGFGFVLQTAGTGALGNYGSGLGYTSMSGPSVAVLFNTYDPNGGVGVALGIDGNQDGSYQSLSSVNLTNSDPKAITIEYDSAAQTMTVMVTDTTTHASATPIVFDNVNLGDILESSDAYVGFTGGDGSATSTQQFSNYTFTGVSSADINSSTQAASPTNSNSVKIVPLNISGFGGNGTGWQANQAPISNNILTLNNSSAFYTTPEYTPSGFTTSFTYTNPPNTGSGGFAFVVQTAGPQTLPVAGEEGYASNFGPSVAVLFGSDRNARGLGIDGNLIGLYQILDPPIDLSNNDPKNITIVYNSAAQTMSVTVEGTNGDHVSFEYDNVNVEGACESSRAYVGFVGLDDPGQQITNFTYTSNINFLLSSTYTYTKAGDFALDTQITGLDGTNDVSNAQQLMNVIAAPLTAVSVTPPANATIGQPIATFNDVLLYHFADSKTPSATASDFTATVNWGDNSDNTSDDGSNTVSIVADPTGGFDVLGSHNYTAVGSYNVTTSVSGSDGTTYNNDPPFQFGATLFHFTDANSNATASDYVATVNWGDGTSNSSNDGTGTVTVVADSKGGFDVIGSHTYAQQINDATFSVQISEAGGPGTSASTNSFNVLYPDQPLIAGTLSVPSVTTEGQSISNQLLFQFTDPDFDAQASDYQATVVWGDGTFNSSNDTSNSVQVQQISTNPDGSIVFGVYGSHTYIAGSGYFEVKVADQGDARSAKPDLGGQIIGGATATPLTIADRPVTLTSGSTFTASENSLSSVQTVATFTDPGGVQFSYIPGLNAPTVSGSGGSLAAGTYYYTVTGTTANGESTPSNQVSATTTGSTSTVTLTWNAAPGATGYKIYRGTSAGAENTLIATTTNATTLSFTDTGSETTSAASPPTINTASGHPEANPNPYVATIRWGDGSVTEATLSSQINYGPANLSSSYVPVVTTPTVSSTGGSLAAGTYYYTVTSTTANSESTISNEVSATTTGNSSAITLSWGQVAGATGYHIYRGTAPGAEDILVATITSGTTLSFTDDGTVSNNFVIKPQLIIGHPYVSSSSTPGIVLGSDDQTFSTNLAHEYIEDGQTSYTITTTVNHNGVLSQTTTTASVAVPAVDVTAGPTFSADKGVPSSVQTVATFTDPAGGEYFVPQQNAPTVSKSGGTLAAGTYYYTVTSTTAFGESTASNEVSATTTGSSSSVQLNWNQVADATGYKIYRGTSPGKENTLIGTLLGSSSLNFSDVGKEATSAASPPTDTSADYPPSDPNPYVATVQLGDNTSSTATLANGGLVLGSDGKTFSVNLAHQYAGAGTYDITTTLNHDGVSSPPVMTTADVAGITVTAASPFTTSYGTALTNVTLATFSETFASNNASDYTATINWGDNQTTNGVIGGSNGNFTVTASHNYSAVGSYPISIAVSLNSDSAVTSSDSTKATVNPAQISYTIGNDKQTYGSPANLAADLPSAISTGINGETLDITYSSTGDTNTAAVGTYAITGTVSNGTGLASNYTVTLTNGTLTVNPAQISYTIGNDKQTYGSPANLAADLPSSFSTGINGETLDITYSSSGDTPTANVGTYAITGTLSNGTGLLSNYIVTLNSGTLTVNPASISHTIGNDSQTYGSPANLAADLGSTIATGVNGETLDITYSSSGDTPTANVGTYAITGTLSNGTGLLSNYIVTLNSGTLTVNPAQISYTIGNDKQIYGSLANLAADLPSSFHTGINGETLSITYSSSGDTKTAAVGPYAITGTLANGTGLVSNYIVTLTNGALTVSPAKISYTIGNDSQSYGSPANLAADLPSSFQTGINGETLDITYSSTGDTNTAVVGNYAITGTVSNGTGLVSNYTVTLKNGTLTINPAVSQTQLSSLSILPNPLNGTAGVTLTVQVTNPQVGVNEGVVSVNLAGQTANGTVVNGQTSMQLTVPLGSMIGNQPISLSYADNASPANFEPSSTTATVSLGLLNALIPGDVTLTSGGGEVDAIPLPFGMLELFFTNQQLTEVRLGPLDLHIQYVSIGDLLLVVVNGIPWQVDVFGPQGQFLGAITLVGTTATTP